jgi:hypothetical protein
VAAGQRGRVRVPKVSVGAGSVGRKGAGLVDKAVAAQSCEHHLPCLAANARLAVSPCFLSAGLVPQLPAHAGGVQAADGRRRLRPPGL